MGTSFEIGKRKFASLVEKKGIARATYTKSSLNCFLDVELKINCFDELQEEETELKIVENFN